MKKGLYAIGRNQGASPAECPGCRRGQRRFSQRSSCTHYHAPVKAQVYGREGKAPVGAGQVDEPGQISNLLRGGDIKHILREESSADHRTQHASYQQTRQKALRTTVEGVPSLK